MKYLLAVFLFCAAWPTQAQPGQPVNLAGVATIRFPEPAQVVDTLGQRIYSAQADGLTYMVMSRHVDAQPGFRLGEGELDGFYQDLAKGVVSASQGKVLAQKSFEAGGARGVELVYTNARNPVFPPEITSRTIYLNGYLLTYQVMPTGAATATFPARQAAFFNSFQLQPAAAKALRQYTLDSAGQPAKSGIARLGYLTGKVIFYVLLAGLGVFLVRRFKLIGRSS